MWKRPRITVAFRAKGRESEINVLRERLYLRHLFTLYLSRYGRLNELFVLVRLNDSSASLSNILPNRKLNKYINKSGAKLSKARRHSCSLCIIHINLNLYFLLQLLIKYVVLQREERNIRNKTDLHNES